MDYAQMKAFIQVADCGSMSAAAKLLYLSPVTLYQQMNQLEDEANCKLFTRSTQGVALTPAGKHFYDGAKYALKQLDILLNECRQIEQKDKSTISVCIYRPYNFISYGNSYSMIRPNIKFLYQSWQPISNKLSTWMEEQGIDIKQIGYCASPLEEGLTFLPIGADQICCYCGKTHPLSQKEAVTLDDLVQYSVSSFQDFTDNLDLLERVLKEKKCTLHREAYSDLKVLKCCASGGVYLLEESMAGVFDQLCKIPLNPAWPYIHCIVYKKDAPRHVLDFVNYVRSCIGEEHVKEMEAIIETYKA